MVISFLFKAVEASFIAIDWLYQESKYWFDKSQNMISSHKVAATALTGGLLILLVISQLFPVFTGGQHLQIAGIPVFSFSYIWAGDEGTDIERYAEVYGEYYSQNITFSDLRLAKAHPLGAAPKKTIFTSTLTNLYYLTSPQHMGMWRDGTCSEWIDTKFGVAEASQIYGEYYLPELANPLSSVMWWMMQMGLLPEDYAERQFLHFCDAGEIIVSRQINGTSEDEKAAELLKIYANTTAPPADFDVSKHLTLCLDTVDVSGIDEADPCWFLYNATNHRRLYLGYPGRGDPNWPYLGIAFVLKKPVLDSTDLVLISKYEFSGVQGYLHTLDSLLEMMFGLFTLGPMYRWLADVIGNLLITIFVVTLVGVVWQFGKMVNVL